MFVQPSIKFAVSPARFHLRLFIDGVSRSAAKKEKRGGEEQTFPADRFNKRQLLSLTALLRLTHREEVPGPLL